MSFYLIVEVKIKDERLYSEYVNRVHDIVTKYGGKYLARGGEITSITKNWKPERIVIVEFKDREQIRQWLESSEYREIAQLRENSTITKAVIVEGC